MQVIGKLVHYSDWASQPDVHFSCGTYTTPGWGSKEGLPEGVYVSEDNELYTFEHVTLVTCPKCRGEATGIASLRAQASRYESRLHVKNSLRLERLRLRKERFRCGL